MSNSQEGKNMKEVHTNKYLRESLESYQQLSAFIRTIYFIVLIIYLSFSLIYTNNIYNSEIPYKINIKNTLFYLMLLFVVPYFSVFILKKGIFEPLNFVRRLLGLGVE